MTPFNSSRFLCSSIPSFGVSTTSPKNSSSFNISPTLTIIFIKHWNCHQMKNNIRYKGNTNNTSVIIFLSQKSQKLPAMLLCLGEPPVRFLWCCCSSFLIFILLLYLHLSMFFILLLFFIHIFFSTSSLTLPWTIAGFLHPFYTISPARRRGICDTFIFQPFRYLLAASATALSGHFLATNGFYLMFLHRHSTTCIYQGLLWSRQFFLEVCRVSSDWLILETQAWPICLFDSK